MTVEVNVTYPTCHGCIGKGWVDTQKGAQTCPICRGKGYLDGTENDLVRWR